MKVVFLEDVPGTASIGEIKEVKAGFARNYLLPRRLAAPATESLVKSAEARAVKETRKQDAKDSDARAVASRLEDASYTIAAKAGPAGKLFGSVGPGDIAARIEETLGHEFARHDVLLPEAVKELGDYSVPVRLTKNINATISFSVVGEDGTTAADIRARAESGEPAPAQRGEEPSQATVPEESAMPDDAGSAAASDESEG